MCNHSELFERREVKSPFSMKRAPYSVPKLVYRQCKLNTLLRKTVILINVMAQSWCRKRNNIFIKNFSYCFIPMTFISWHTWVPIQEDDHIEFLLLTSFKSSVFIICMLACHFMEVHSYDSFHLCHIEIWVFCNWYSCSSTYDTWHFCMQIQCELHVDGSVSFIYL